MDGIILLILLAIIGAFIWAIISGTIKGKEAKKQRELWHEQLKHRDDFKAETIVDGPGFRYIFCVDKQNKQILYLDKSIEKLIPFNRIISYELLEDSNVISSKSITRTIGGAAIGGVLAGGAGAVVGGLSGNQTHKKEVSKVQIKLHLRDSDDYTFVIECFSSDSPIKTDSINGTLVYKPSYENAVQICDILSVIIDETRNSNTENKNASGISYVSELEKLFNLKEKGALTEEEFLQMKNNLLNK